MNKIIRTMLYTAIVFLSAVCLFAIYCMTPMGVKDRVSGQFFDEYLKPYPLVYAGLSIVGLLVVSIHSLFAKKHNCLNSESNDETV